MTYSPDDLKDYDDDFASAPQDEGPKAGPVPPGRYQVEIMRALIEESKYDHCPELKLHCKILNTPQAGRFVFPSGSFNRDKCITTKSGQRAPIEFLKSMVGRLGFDPPIAKASDIPRYLEAMIGRIVEVAVFRNERNEDFPKVYLQRFIAAMEPGPGSDPGPLPGTDDDIPF